MVLGCQHHCHSHWWPPGCVVDCKVGQKFSNPQHPQSQWRGVMVMGLVLQLPLLQSLFLQGPELKECFWVGASFVVCFFVSNPFLFCSTAGSPLVVTFIERLCLQVTEASGESVGIGSRCGMWFRQMWICFCDAFFYYGSTPQVLYSRKVCHLHCCPIFSGQHRIPIEQGTFMYKTHHARSMGVGWARVTKPQPIPIPVCTHGIYLHGFTNP